MHGLLNVKFMENCCLLVRDTVQFGTYKRFVGKICFWLQGRRISGFRLNLILWRRQQHSPLKRLYLPKYAVSSLRRLEPSQSPRSEPRTSHDYGRWSIATVHLFSNTSIILLKNFTPHKDDKLASNLNWNVLQHIIQTRYESNGFFF